MNDIKKVNESEGRKIIICEKGDKENKRYEYK
jgi:hypothetical protein